MYKYFVLLLLLLPFKSEARDPKFMKGQCVSIKVPKFESLVCKPDIFQVYDYNEKNSTYSLHGIGDCRGFYDVPETEMTLVDCAGNKF